MAVSIYCIRDTWAYLEAAAEHWATCSSLAVNSDRSVRALKGPTRPITPEDDRARRPGSVGMRGLHHGVRRRHCGKIIM